MWSQSGKLNQWYADKHVSGSVQNGKRPTENPVLDEPVKLAATCNERYEHKTISWCNGHQPYKCPASIEKIEVPSA